MSQAQEQSFPANLEATTEGPVRSAAPAFGAAALDHVPAYATAAGPMRERLDLIITENAGRNLDDAASFGDGANEENLSVSTSIIAAMSTEMDGVFRQPLEDVADKLRTLNLEDIQKSTAQLMNRGIEVASNNKGGTAVFFGAMITGQFWLAAATGGVVAVKEHLRALREEKSPDTPEALTNRIRNAVLEATDMQNKLASAEARVPGVLSRIDALAAANGQSYYDLTAHLAAGHEILRRVVEDEIPELRHQMEARPDYETETALHGREQYATTLERKLSILARSRADAVGGTYVLRDVREAILNNQMDLKSLRTSELATYGRAIATSGLGLDSYRVTKVASDVRNHIEALQKDAVTIAGMAQQAALDGRADSPERLQRQIDMLTDFRARVENARTAQETLDRTRREKLKQLEKSVTGLLRASVENILEQDRRPLNLPQARP